MAEEVVIKDGVVALEAGVTITKGDLITVDSAGKWKLAAVGEVVWFVAEGDAAAGERVSGRRAVVIKAAVKGEDAAGDAALAVGDDLYVDAGYLNGDATNNGAKTAKLLEAVGSGVTAVVKIMVVS